MPYSLNLLVLIICEYIAYPKYFIEINPYNNVSSNKEENGPTTYTEAVTNNYGSSTLIDSNLIENSNNGKIILTKILKLISHNTKSNLEKKVLKVQRIFPNSSLTQHEYNKNHESYKDDVCQFLRNNVTHTNQ